MLKYNIPIYVFIFFIIHLFLPSLIPAQQITITQQQARAYRDKGYDYQVAGRLNEAMSCYQKAITLDPGFVIAYNDLAILFEAKGWQDRAEELYLEALKLETNYPNSYSNLALLYEKKNDYRKAAELWKRRIALGVPGDPWLKKAEERLVVLRQYIPELMQEHLYKEADSLEKELFNKRRNEQLYNEAITLDKNAEYSNALEKVKLILSYNPENKVEIEKFKNELEIRARIAEMEKSFHNAMRYYKQDNLQEAKRVLNSIATAITSSQKK